MSPQWISAIAESFTGLSVVLLLIQLRADHERSRRQAAVEKIMVWTNSMTLSSSSVQKLVDKLTQKDCDCLNKIEPFKIDAEHRPLLESCFSEDEEFAAVVDGHILLRPTQVSLLKYVALRYLNTVEGVLAAWHYGIADEKIIFDEFKPLIEEKNGKTILKHFRIANGIEHYPAIQSFYNRNQPEASGGKRKII